MQGVQFLLLASSKWKETPHLQQDDEACLPLVPGHPHHPSLKDPASQLNLLLGLSNTTTG